MFYRAVRALISLLLKTFYRLEPANDPRSSLDLEGPVIFVGNHPNGLIDPGLLFVLARRQVTFLAKAPIFSMPVLGWVVRGIGALPVYRKQDDPSQMGKNEGSLTAAVEALARGGAITLFPEGKSHSEPQLAELKTGCARIALRAVELGAVVRIVPVGLTYEAKNRFRSRVRVDVGAPLEVKGVVADATQLTDAISQALETVTLNLEQWEDLPLLKTAEALYALESGQAPHDDERLRAFARGVRVLRSEQPEKFEQLKARVHAFGQRLKLLSLEPRSLGLSYHPLTVLVFCMRNLVWLLGLPVFALGMAVFAIPYLLSSWGVRRFGVEVDLQATVKVLLALVLVPAWWLLLTGVAWAAGGVQLGWAGLLGAPVLAFFTRYFFERRASALKDARTFLVLVSRRGLRARLVDEGSALAREIAEVARAL